jgi:hypothetical protein
MKYKEAQELNECMTKWHETHVPQKTYPVRVDKMLEVMKAYSLEITRLAGLLADEMLKNEGYEIDDLEDRSLSEITREHFMPDGHKILSVEELIEEEDYEDPLS